MTVKQLIDRLSTENMDAQVHRIAFDDDMEVEVEDVQRTSENVVIIV